MPRTCYVRSSDRGSSVKRQGSIWVPLVCVCVCVCLCVCGGGGGGGSGNIQGEHALFNLHEYTSVCHSIFFRVKECTFAKLRAIRCSILHHPCSSTKRIIQWIGTSSRTLKDQSIFVASHLRDIVFFIIFFFIGHEMAPQLAVVMYWTHKISF